MAHPLERVCRWNRWANRQVLETLRESEGEPSKALAAYQHVLETELVWLRRFNDDPRPMIPLWGEVSLAQVEAWTAEAAALLAGRTAKLGDGGGAEEFRYRNSKGNEFVDVVEDSLMHMLLHSSQYRGEAAGFLNAAGHRAPDLDLMFWARRGEPE
ncbi:MAG: hypothetical protein KC495_09640 [Dehalococcoidia bacterium]|nr:hypothetical protein [Dehalococcoidia bacterium]